MKLKKTENGYRQARTEWWEWVSIIIGLAGLGLWFGMKIGGMW